MTDIEKRVAELRAEINYHLYRYHTLDDPVISDYEYDQMLVKLREIEGFTKYISQSSEIIRIWFKFL